MFHSLNLSLNGIELKAMNTGVTLLVLLYLTPSMKIEIENSFFSLHFVLPTHPSVKSQNISTFI
jgi:hypothetical protein